MNTMQNTGSPSFQESMALDRLKDIIIDQAVGTAFLDSKEVSMKSHSTKSFLDELQYNCKMNGGDFRSRPIITCFRRIGPSLVTQIQESRSQPKHSINKVVMHFREQVNILKSEWMNNKDKCIGFLELLCESSLMSVRFVSLLICISLLPTSLEVKGHLEELITRRSKDVNENIRLLAGIGGILVFYFSINGDRTNAFNTVKTLLRDPSKYVRMITLDYISKLTIEQMNKLGEQLLSQLGDEILTRCFDADSEQVSARAIGVLSNINLGELLLAGDEAKYQAISNLVWNPGMHVSKAALIFIDNHILASPGIINSSIADSRKLEMLAEFIEQYSDGLIYPLTGRIVIAISDSVKFISNSMSYIPVLESLVGELKLANIRTGLVSSLLSSQVSAASQEHAAMKSGSTKRRLNCILEILSASLQINRESFCLDTGILKLLREILEIWDEYEDRYPVLPGTLSMTQQVVIAECDKYGLRSTRYCFEVILEIIQFVLRSERYKVNQKRIQNNEEYRRDVFEQTKAFIWESGCERE